MSDNLCTLLFTLIGLSGVVRLLQKKDKDVIENFGTNPPQTVNVERVMQQCDGPRKGQFVSVPGTYQAILNPRQAGMVDYGAFIRYNRPEQGQMANSMGSLQYVLEPANTKHAPKHSSVSRARWRIPWGLSSMS